MKPLAAGCRSLRPGGGLVVHRHATRLALFAVSPMKFAGRTTDMNNVCPVPTVLIVDDAPTNLVLLQAILAPEGFRVLKAKDGLCARELLRHEKADLILLDVMMPGESGFETCARLKSDPTTADIPVIFLSAQDDAQS